MKPEYINYLIDALINACNNSLTQDSPIRSVRNDRIIDPFLTSQALLPFSHIWLIIYVVFDKILLFLLSKLRKTVYQRWFMWFSSNTSQLMMTGLRDTDLTLRGKAGSGSGLTLAWAGAAFLCVNTREATGHGQSMTQDCTIIRAPG